MTGQDRVRRALSHQTADRIPLDLGGSRTTGISAFAYRGLREALGLTPRPPRLYDTIQVLALPEMDVLDALGCDVVHVTLDHVTNAFEEPERWKPYDHNGRLSALVMNPDVYRVLANGFIVQRIGETNAYMSSGSTVFDRDGTNERFDLVSEFLEPDWATLKQGWAARRYTDHRIRSIRDYCRRVRSSTDRAVFLSGLEGGLGFPGGMAVYSMVCLVHPDWVHERHRLATEHAVAQMESLLPEIREYVDVFMLAADDQGTQNGPVLPPALFRELYVPYYRRMTDAVHRLAPGVKVFLHSCGAILELIPAIADAGFDVLNPVQWSAGGRGYADWKEASRGRIALWGGGVNTQSTLPLGSREEVVDEVSHVVPVLASGGGYVFSSVHNLLADVDPQTVVAMYRTAAAATPG